MRHLARWPLILAAMALLASCGGSEPQPPTPTSIPDHDPVVVAAEQPLVIGVSVALSGQQEAAGRDLADAVDLAVEDFAGTIHGHNILIVREDDSCNDAERATAAAESLLRVSGIVAVVGPMCTTGVQAASDLLDERGIVHVTPSAARSDLSMLGHRLFFRTSWRDDAQARIQAMYMRGVLRSDTAVVIDDGEPYGRALADAFIPDFEEQGGRVLSRERIERGETDFSGITRAIVAAEPDAVVFEGFNPEAAIFLKSLREEGYDGDFVGPDSLLNARDFVVPAGVAAEGAIITAGPVPDEAFNQHFNERFGRLPSTSFVLQAYDATRMLLASLRAVAEQSEAGGLAVDPETFAANMRDTPHDGLTGRIDFDDAGDRTGDSAAQLGLAIYRVNNGAFELVQ